MIAEVVEERHAVHVLECRLACSNCMEDVRPSSEVIRVPAELDPRAHRARNIAAERLPDRSESEPSVVAFGNETDDGCSTEETVERARLRAGFAREVVARAVSAGE